MVTNGNSQAAARSHNAAMKTFLAALTISLLSGAAMAQQTKPGCETLPPLMTLFLNSSDGRRAFSQVNRFYGDGLNKLEPKDVEEMPCPDFPIQPTLSNKELQGRLIALEKLPQPTRQHEIDRLASVLLRLPH